jgi:hypothetical protein
VDYRPWTGLVVRTYTIGASSKEYLLATGKGGQVLFKVDFGAKDSVGYVKLMDREKNKIRMDLQGEWFLSQ